MTSAKKEIFEMFLGHMFNVLCYLQVPYVKTLIFKSFQKTKLSQLIYAEMVAAYTGFNQCNQILKFGVFE